MAWAEGLFLREQSAGIVAEDHQPIRFLGAGQQFNLLSPAVAFDHAGLESIQHGGAHSCIGLQPRIDPSHRRFQGQQVRDDRHIRDAAGADHMRVRSRALHGIPAMPIIIHPRRGVA
ncbi:MAG: hypothetical protein IPK70_17455 [Flavobacteriales bacterium]|nr:hypothetical protein [Flavobacteriales bacterium]